MNDDASSRHPWYAVTALVLLLALSVGSFGIGNCLAGFIGGMLSATAWTWMTRPVPNPYDDTPYDPDGSNEGF